VISRLPGQEAVKALGGGLGRHSLTLTPDPAPDAALSLNNATTVLRY
jgi:hypothetical protein